jgi:hypothetical protein
MGSNFATELADGALGLDMANALRVHLRSNHYPPVPSSMVQPCMDAIQAFIDEEPNKLIELPEGVSWRGETSAPASAIAESHHLDAWLPHAYYCDCEDCGGSDE